MYDIVFGIKHRVPAFIIEHGKPVFFSQLTQGFRFYPI